MDGNKRGKVFAFDKDLRRLTLLRRRVDESGAAAGGAIETRLQDFLEVDPGDRRYSKARERTGHGSGSWLTSSFVWFHVSPFFVKDEE